MGGEEEEEEKKLMVRLGFIKIVRITAQWLGALSAGEGAPPPEKVHWGERLGVSVWNAPKGPCCGV